jgi:hypothetical protein
MSQPAACSRRAKATAASPSKPPSTQSIALMRTDSGPSQTARHAAKTSSGNFARSRPYSSSRTFVSGDRKLESR